jgi:hypothetical protein
LLGGAIRNRPNQPDSSSTPKTFFHGTRRGDCRRLSGRQRGLERLRRPHRALVSDTSMAHVREGKELANNFTHVNETTLTVGGLVVYGVARMAKAKTSPTWRFTSRNRSPRRA